MMSDQAGTVSQSNGRVGQPDLAEHLLQSLNSEGVRNAVKPISDLQWPMRGSVQVLREGTRRQDRGNDVARGLADGAAGAAGMAQQDHARSTPPRQRSPDGVRCSS